MIERLLAAERALGTGDLDQAERLFGQVADADDRNAIAVAGLAEVAHRRGDVGQARALAERALAIDPEEAAAARLARDLEPAAAVEPAPVAAPEPAPVAAPEAAAAPQAAAAVTSEPAALPAPSRGGLLGWLRRLLGRRS